MCKWKNSAILCLASLGTYRKILKNMSWDKTQTIPADLSGMIPQGRCSALASEKLRCQAQHVENLKSHIPNPIYTHIESSGPTDILHRSHCGDTRRTPKPWQPRLHGFLQFAAELRLCGGMWAGTPDGRLPALDCWMLSWTKKEHNVDTCGENEPSSFFCQQLMDYPVTLECLNVAINK